MADHSNRQVPISEAMRLAIDHHQAGRLQQAEAIYRAVLESEPTHAGANYNLGLIALQSGRPREAVPVMREALQREPGNAGHWINYAVAVAGSGDPQGARQILLQARERGLGGKELAGALAQVERMIQAPRSTVVETVGDEGAAPVRSLNLASLIDLYHVGKYAQVEAQAHELSAQFPQSAPLARLLGLALLAQNKFEDAREALAQASEAMPDDAQVQYLLGLALRRLRRNEEAGVAFEQSLALAPDDVETLLNASANAVTLGDPAEARRYAERALALRPDSVDVLRVLADAAAAGGSLQEAIELYRQGIALDPKAVDLYVNLGDALTNLERPEEAAREVERALALRPDYVPAHRSLGRALHELGETVAARKQFHLASELAPELPEVHTAYLFSLAHDETVSPEHCFEEHMRLGEVIESPLRRFRRPHQNDRDPERGLRVGFVSGDLRNHPVAYLIEPIWQALRGGRHQVIAYANQRQEDEVSARLRALTDSWARVERLDDEALAERIRGDRIDILFDLSGHTTNNRLAVFAMKPAPVQVTWIGYPATTGLSTMDYRFVRGLQADDESIDRLFCEKLVRFRYRGFQPEPSAPEVQPLPALRSGRVTFGSFNRPSKISESTIDLWSRVLQAVPGSTLLIAATGEARTQNRLRALFEARGIAAERLDFRPRVSLAEYMAMHHEVDIALDTFPYTGGTTTSHALWMGVPVLTLVGPTLQQRQASSILGTLDLYEWAVPTEQAYVQRAVAATADLEALDRLRQGLRGRMAALFQDSRSELARELDVALQSMWRRWCADLAPERITVTP